MESKKQHILGYLNQQKLYIAANPDSRSLKDLYTGIISSLQYCVGLIINNEPQVVEELTKHKEKAMRMRDSPVIQTENNLIQIQGVIMGVDYLFKYVYDRPNYKELL